MPPLAILGGIAAAGSIGSAAIGAHAAGSAANAQVDAANRAAELQHEDAQAALGFNEKQWETTQANVAPWLQAGSSGLANLSYLLGINPQSFATTPQPGVKAGSTGSIPSPFGVTAPGGPQQALQNQPGGRTIPWNPNRYNPGGEDVAMDGSLTALMARRRGPPASTVPMMSSLINTSLGERGSLMQPFGEKFVAPTDVTEKNDPGYQFRLQEGQRALERSAAARGSLLSGRTAAAEGKYAQDYASNEYGNVYNRRFNEYANRYNVFSNEQARRFNQLASVSGVGQTTANQLGMLGQNSANNASNILLTSGQQIGQDYQNAGAATASGYVGGANAWSGALTNLSQLPWLYMMNRGGGGGGGTWGT